LNAARDQCNDVVCVRFSIVARSLGVILASPLLALPMGFAGESTSAQLRPEADQSRSHAGGDDGGRASSARLLERPPLAPAETSEPSAPQAIAAATEAALAVAPPGIAAAAPEEVEVSVNCAMDGCVVSTGLDVVVLASPPRRRF